MNGKKDLETIPGAKTNTKTDNIENKCFVSVIETSPRLATWILWLRLFPIIVIMNVIKISSSCVNSFDESDRDDNYDQLPLSFSLVDNMLTTSWQVVVISEKTIKRSPRHYRASATSKWNSKLYT